MGRLLVSSIWAFCVILFSKLVNKECLKVKKKMAKMKVKECVFMFIINPNRVELS